MKAITNLLGRRARVFFLDPDFASDQMRKGYIGVIRFVAIGDGAAMVIGLELEEACAHPFTASYLEPGAILFLRDRGATAIGSIAVEPMATKAAAVPS